MDPWKYRRAVAKRGRVRHNDNTQAAHCTCPGRMVVHDHTHKCLPVAVEMADFKAQLAFKALRLKQKRGKEDRKK